MYKDNNSSCGSCWSCPKCATCVDDEMYIGVESFECPSCHGLIDTTRDKVQKC
ncbi:MAG: hypothetical protein Q4F88_03570 [Eubacteriales bacterium]|nr:hypothetical protein [Eubacteriales bacterium]